MRELFLGIIPMKRPVAAEEIAAAAVFLASDHARSINGDTIAIDGGLSFSDLKAGWRRRFAHLE